MSHTNSQIYYKTRIKLIKSALHIAEQLFCQQKCNQNCTNQCNRHPQARILHEKQISDNSELLPRIFVNSLYPPQSQQSQQPNPPSNIKKNPIKFSIYKILNHKSNTTKDKYIITKQYHTYICQWSIQNNTTYYKWMS